jgi:hypothetical protein
MITATTTKRMPTSLNSNSKVYPVLHVPAKIDAAWANLPGLTTLLPTRDSNPGHCAMICEGDEIGVVALPPSRCAMGVLIEDLWDLITR